MIIFMYYHCRMQQTVCCLVEPVHHHDVEEDVGNIDHYGEPGVGVVGVVLSSVAQHVY